MIAAFPVISRRQRRHLLTLFVLACLGFYFGYHLVSGNKGVVAMFQMANKLEEAQSRLDYIKMQRMELGHRVKMLSPESLDLDLLDEQSREVLGYAGRNEIIYFLPDEKQ